MPRNRVRQREKKKSEKMLELRNEYGALDSTPFLAVKNITKNSKYKSEVIK
jgi:hypothetical protein